jgi:hypothetical protein
MEKETKQLSPEELHAKQTWLEIWLPLIICLVIIAGAIALIITSAVGGSAGIAQLSAISIIFMVIPVLLLLIFTLSLIIVIDYFLIKGNRALPKYGQIARQKVTGVTTKTQEVLLSVVSNILKIQSIFEIVKDFFTPKKKQESPVQENTDGKRK